MPLSRRTFLKAAAAVPAMTCSTSLFAATNIALGNIQIDVLDDGKLRLPGSFVFDGMPEDELKTVLEKYQISLEGVEPDCNLTLVRDGERTILFDVGAGPNFMASAGKLTEAMEAMDLDPAEVTHVVFTHGHPDHLWGLLDDFDEPLFPEAAYLIDSAEFDYWIDPGTIDTIGEARQAFAAGAARNLKAIEENITRFKPGEEILPGVLARGTPGHTPGHTSFEIRSGSESVLVVGDAIGNHHVAFERPAWETNTDQDKTLGARTRAGLLDQVANEGMRVIGYHFPYPGIGRVAASGSSYRFVQT